MNSKRNENTTGYQGSQAISGDDGGLVPLSYTTLINGDAFGKAAQHEAARVCRYVRLTSREQGAAPGVDATTVELLMVDTGSPLGTAPRDPMSACALSPSLVHFAVPGGAPLLEARARLLEVRLQRLLHACTCLPHAVLPQATNLRQKCGFDGEQHKVGCEALMSLCQHRALVAQLLQVL
jgi:hypothetical protein